MVVRCSIGGWRVNCDVVSTPRTANLAQGGRTQLNSALGRDRRNLPASILHGRAVLLPRLPDLHICIPMAISVRSMGGSNDSGECQNMPLKSQAPVLFLPPSGPAQVGIFPL